MREKLAYEDRLDLRDLDCPMPVMQTKAKLARMTSGDHLKITANNREFIKEIHALSTQLGHTILEEDSEGETLTFVVKKK